MRNGLCGSVATLVLLLTAHIADAQPKLDPQIFPGDVRQALESAERFELISLYPSDKLGGEQFHGYSVLGRTIIADAGTRARLITALKEGVEDNKYGIAAACFNPRHGIRATHGSTSVDLVICFQCYQALVYYGDGRRGEFLPTSKPEPAFNEVLRAAKLPLSRDLERRN